MSKTLELFGNIISYTDEDVAQTEKQEKARARRIATAQKKQNMLPFPELQPAIAGQGWQNLFTATTRLHFFKIFLNWKKKGGMILPIDGLKMACFPDDQVLYYYDFFGCHQYSKVMLQRFCDNSIEKLERDYQRYIRMLANDNRVVGKLLARSIARQVKWRNKGNKMVVEPLEEQAEDISETFESEVKNATAF